MVEKQSSLPIRRCVKCGDTVPEGKTLCWCCEHSPKLHVAEDIKNAGTINYTHKKIQLGVAQ